ncbi:MAG: AraC family transcriptional regulator [Cyclobacteriaceae bacterium]
MEKEKTILVKGMVCDRCIQVVTQLINNLGLEVRDISLGSVTVVGVPNRVSIKIVEKVLAEKGLQVLEDRNTALANKVKQVLNELLDQDRVYEMRPKYSKLISEKLDMPYATIKSLFLYAEGMTLEKYIIHQRLEKAKELMVCTSFTFTEIAYILGFSSLQHLSNQFKEMTGLSPSYFRKIKGSGEYAVTHHETKNN